MDARRRSLLAGAGALTGLAMLPWPRVAAAAQHAHAAAQSPGSSKPALLDAGQFRLVDAIAARIVPTDDQPGAREAGVVWFVDRALADFMASSKADFLAGLAAFAAAAEAAHPGSGGFAALTEAEQDAFLRSQEQTPFFGAIRFMTICGLLADPAYGGNRDGVGWKLIGFEVSHEYTPPFGWYDRDYPGYQPACAGDLK